MDKKDYKPYLVYLVVLVISVLYIIVGHEIAMTNYQPFNEDDQSVVVTATVQEIKDRYSESYQISETEYAENETILFTAKIRSGEEKGQVVEAAQTLDYFTAINLRRWNPVIRFCCTPFPAVWLKISGCLVIISVRIRFWCYWLSFWCCCWYLDTGRALTPLYR